MISPKRAARLKDKKHREREQLFLGEGPALVEEAREAPLHTFVDFEEVRRVSALETPTGPVGVFSFLDVPQEDLLEASSRIVLLHGVQDPGNVGTIIRAAHAFGFGVALSTGCADLYNPKTVRATMGSIFHAQISRGLDSIKFLNAAREAHFFRMAAVAERGDSPDHPPEERLVIAVGAEGSGLPEKVISACERRVTIPSRAASLNAAMAASILLYQAYARVLP